MKQNHFDVPAQNPERPKEPLDFIEQQESGNILFRRGDYEISLAQYLPVGWKFQKVAIGYDYGQHEVHFDERTVKYNKRELENKESREYALASLLHELGHLKNEMGDRRPENEPSAELAKAYKPHMYKVRWFEMTVAMEKLSIAEIEKMKSSELKEKVTGFIKADDALKEKFLNSAKELYKNERGAWARALEWLRKLQNEGLETRATREEFLKYVHIRLGTYEKSLLDELKEYGLEKSDVARDIEKKRKATSDDLIEEDFRQFAKKFGDVD